MFASSPCLFGDTMFMGSCEKKVGAAWKIISVDPVNQGLSLICISTLNKEKIFDTLYKHLQCCFKRLILPFSSLKSPVASCWTWNRLQSQSRTTISLGLGFGTRVRRRGSS